MLGNSLRRSTSWKGSLIVYRHSCDGGFDNLLHVLPGQAGFRLGHVRHRLTDGLLQIGGRESGFRLLRWGSFGHLRTDNLLDFRAGKTYIGVSAGDE